jgi:FlaA1/EpsC-like NDP-sugar epimerase
MRLGESYADFDRSALVFAALTLFSILVFMRMGLYRAVLRYLGHKAFEQILIAVMGSSAMLLALTLFVPGAELPRSTFAIYGTLAFLFIGGSRWVARLLLGGKMVAQRGAPVAVYGAGAAGQQLSSMLHMGPEYCPVAFLDDAADLQGRSIDGMPVLNPQAPDLADRLSRLHVSEILLAIPSAKHSRRRAILKKLEVLQLAVRTVPGLRDIISGRARLDELRKIQIEDLLGRDPVPPHDDLLHRCIEDRTVLVTGAGGSIGTELCRQVVGLGTRRLLMLDHSEYDLYAIDQELHELSKGRPVEIVPILGSVLDRARLGEVFSSYAVDTVYHAAAYKHVPMVEHNPMIGVRNNVFGTLYTAQAAQQAGVKDFVLISTDKAVRPTNVMGATKRLAELIMQGMSERPAGTRFSMVRFGNVLGSSGSVIPKFRRQLESGGPLTVTHPNVTRYFMTIPEAVQLVIQASGMAKGGEVFVLDMGRPVRIYDLAVQMIRLAGLELRTPEDSEGDIEIQFTGLRPGEKLYEELLIGEDTERTEHPRIQCAFEERMSWGEYNHLLVKLQKVLLAHDETALRSLLRQSVNGYIPQDEMELVVPLAEPQDTLEAPQVH